MTAAHGCRQSRGQVGHRRPGGEHQVDAVFPQGPGQGDMQIPGVVTQFEHVAEHRQPPASGAR